MNERDTTSNRYNTCLAQRTGFLARLYSQTDQLGLIYFIKNGPALINRAGLCGGPIGRVVELRWFAFPPFVMGSEVRLGGLLFLGAGGINHADQRIAQFIVKWFRRTLLAKFPA